MIITTKMIIIIIAYVLFAIITMGAWSITEPAVPCILAGVIWPVMISVGLVVISVKFLLNIGKLIGNKLNKIDIDDMLGPK